MSPTNCQQRTVLDGPWSNNVSYTPGFFVDQPLSVVRSGYHDVSPLTAFEDPSLLAAGHFDAFSIMPMWNYRGVPVGAIYEDGTRHLCKIQSPNQERCVKVVWPAVFSVAGWWHYACLWDDLLEVRFWHGSLLEDKKDASGQIYRRNRYYDPESGRFTQEDPIGLAGGLNLYGFADGDPVNFSDPFGLCTGKDGKELPSDQCRGVTAAEGQAIYDQAVKTGKWTYEINNELKDIPNQKGDCTDFCEIGMRNAGLPRLNPTVRTGPSRGNVHFANSTNFAKVTGAPQAGDIIVQGGHAGIFGGSYDTRGRPLGLQNGSGGGVAVIPWGKGVRGLANVEPVFYRRQIPF